MTHRMTIAGVTRDLPICKVTDDLYIGAFILFGDAEITVACARELLKRAPKDYDYLLTAEAKSIVGNGLDRSAGFWGCGVVSPCRGGEPPGVAWRYSAACPSLRGPILSARAERIGRKARQREGLCTKPPFPLESHPPKFGGRVRFADYRARARPPAVPRNRTRSGMSVCVFGGASRIAGRILSARVTSSPVPVGAGLDPPAVTPSFFAERSRPFPTADAKFHSPPPRFPTHITNARHGRRPGSRTVMGEARICNKLRRMGIQREGRLCKKPFPLACLSSDSFCTSGKNRPPEGRTSRQIPPG
jgi:hypothetical protein